MLIRLSLCFHDEKDRATFLMRDFSRRRVFSNLAQYNWAFKMKFHHYYTIVLSQKDVSYVLCMRGCYLRNQENLQNCHINKNLFCDVTRFNSFISSLFKLSHTVRKKSFPTKYYCSAASWSSSSETKHFPLRYFFKFLNAM